MPISRTRSGGSRRRSTRARIANAFGTVTEAQDALTQNASPKIVADWVAVTI